MPTNKKAPKVPHRVTSLPTSSGHVFKVLDGVHWGHGGDAYPGTVLYVSESGRKVYVSRDGATVTDKMGGYVEGPRTCIFKTVRRDIEDCEVWTLRKTGRFTKEPTKTSDYLRPGRVYAQDPSF